MAVDYEVRVYRGWKLSYEKLTSIFTPEQIDELKNEDYLRSMDSWQSDENADWVLGISVFHTPLGTAKRLDIEETFAKYDKEKEMVNKICNMLPKDKNFFVYPDYILAHRVW